MKEIIDMKSELMDIKAIVFDLGGTLMEYVGMPHTWSDYYIHGFNSVNKTLNLGLTENQIDESTNILKKFNPRHYPRENEISAAQIFDAATKHWNKQIDINEIIKLFFTGLNLKTKIYDDSIIILSKLSSKAYKLAALTNLPSAMPDSVFVPEVLPIIQNIDLYISSEVCGFRKPHPKGLHIICEKFNMSPDDLLFIGDEKIDVFTAKNFGCKSVLLCKDGIHKNFGQDITLYTLQNLFELL